MGQERVLGVLPLFHVFAMTVVMNYSVEIAAEMVLLPRYDLATTLKTLLKTKPTVFPAVPTIYAAISKLAAKEKRDLSCIELCISGGAPLPAEVAEQFRALTGASSLSRATASPRRRPVSPATHAMARPRTARSAARCPVRSSRSAIQSIALRCRRARRARSSSAARS